MEIDSDIMAKLLSNQPHFGSPWNARIWLVGELVGLNEMELSTSSNRWDRLSPILILAIAVISITIYLIHVRIILINTTNPEYILMAKQQCDILTV